MSQTEETKNKLKDKGFTYRQIDVISDVCLGQVNREIADRLMVSEKCIKYHLTKIFKKAVVKNRTELAAWASSL